MSNTEHLEAALEDERERGNRLARAYIALSEYTYGSKRHNAFSLVMEYSRAIELDDLAPVRDEVHAEIAALDDWEDSPDDDGYDGCGGVTDAQIDRIADRVANRMAVSIGRGAGR